LDFDRPVPFREGVAYYETALQKADGSTSKGAFGRAVRSIPDVEFDHILKAGFAAELSPTVTAIPVDGFDEPAHSYQRPFVELTVSRPFRDRAFMRAVREAYQNRCAFTGLKLINGG